MDLLPEDYENMGDELQVYFYYIRKLQIFVVMEN